MTNPLEQQVGGNHYKDMKIQPIEFAQLNNLNPCEFSIIKYVCRHKNKNGIEDLKKAKHFIDLLIELEYEDHYEYLDDGVIDKGYAEVHSDYLDKYLIKKDDGYVFSDTYLGPDGNGGFNINNSIRYPHAERNILSHFTSLKKAYDFIESTNIDKFMVVYIDEKGKTYIHRK